MGERQRDLRERIILDIRKVTGVNNKVYKFFAIVVSLCMMFALSMTVLAEKTNSIRYLNCWIESIVLRRKVEDFLYNEDRALEQLKKANIYFIANAAHTFGW